MFAKIVQINQKTKQIYRFSQHLTHRTIKKCLFLKYCSEIENNLHFGLSKIKAYVDEIKVIEKDKNEYKETIIACKPSLNRIASTNFMNEYSKQIRENINNNEDSFFDSKSILPINEKYDDEEDDESQESKKKIIKEIEKNLPVPVKEKNNEKFKILTIKKKLQRKTRSPNASAKKFEEDNNRAQYQKDFITQNSFCKLKKKKLVNSAKKEYSSTIFLGEGTNINGFKIFKDKDIGFNKFWQQYIHENNKDEDVSTDEEQKKIAKDFCKLELADAINEIKNKGWKEMINNYKYYY